ncbi:hypothetical protein LX32DRAFT_210033 [Colletotrichum zoysiae]|uniref:Uncharacterized protein n=1 Tax=Colletotrichum zoysiae TaxID=1216348 RepID=A0AAD9HNF9_9PEZI|nr:hypothetical protein LX32DRAFT_210033 [Colletotrichum zoysiae]
MSPTCHRRSRPHDTPPFQSPFVSRPGHNRHDAKVVQTHGQHPTRARTHPLLLHRRALAGSPAPRRHSHTFASIRKPGQPASHPTHIRLPRQEHSLTQPEGCRFHHRFVPPFTYTVHPPPSHCLIAC